MPPWFHMFRTFALLSVLSGMLPALTGCGGSEGSVNLPAEVLSEDSVAVVYIDGQANSPEQLRQTFDFFVKRWPGEVYPDTVSELYEDAAEVGQNIKAMAFVIGVPEGRRDEPPVTLVVQPKSGISTEEAIQSLPRDLMDAAAPKGEDDGLSLEPVAKGWYALQQNKPVRSWQTEFVIPTGANKNVTGWFNRTLSKAGEERPLKFAFRMTSPLKDVYNDWAQNAARRSRYGEDDLEVKALRAITRIQSGWVAAAIGENPSVTASVSLAGPADAAQVSRWFESDLLSVDGINEMLPRSAGDDRRSAIRQALSLNKPDERTLTLSVTSSELGRLIGPAEKPGLEQIRTQAKKIQQQRERQAKISLQGRAIATQAIRFARDKGGSFPDLTTLVRETSELDFADLVAETSDTQVPAHLSGASEDQQRQWVRQHASYVLLPGPSNMNTQKLVVFLKPEYEEDGIVAAFGDGSSRWMTLDEASSKIRSQTGMLVEQIVATAKLGRLGPQLAFTKALRAMGVITVELDHLVDGSKKWKEAVHQARLARSRAEQLSGTPQWSGSDRYIRPRDILLAALERVTEVQTPNRELRSAATEAAAVLAAWGEKDAIDPMTQYLRVQDKQGTGWTEKPLVPVYAEALASLNAEQSTALIREAFLDTIIRESDDAKRYSSILSRLTTSAWDGFPIPDPENLIQKLRKLKDNGIDSMEVDPVQREGSGEAKFELLLNKLGPDRQYRSPKSGLNFSGGDWHFWLDSPNQLRLRLKLEGSNAAEGDQFTLVYRRHDDETLPWKIANVRNIRIGGNEWNPEAIVAKREKEAQRIAATEQQIRNMLASDEHFMLRTQWEKLPILRLTFGEKPWDERVLGKEKDYV